jgi:hypothetical protein
MNHAHLVGPSWFIIVIRHMTTRPSGRKFLVQCLYIHDTALEKIRRIRLVEKVHIEKKHD